MRTIKIRRPTRQYRMDRMVEYNKIIAEKRMERKLTESESVTAGRILQSHGENRNSTF